MSDVLCLLAKGKSARVDAGLVSNKLHVKDTSASSVTGTFVWKEGGRKGAASPHPSSPNYKIILSVAEPAEALCLFKYEWV